MQTSLALFGRIFEYLDLVPALQDSPGARPLPKAGARGEVELRDVWFRYPTDAGAAGSSEPGRAAERSRTIETGRAAERSRTIETGPWAIEDLSLHIAPGETVAGPGSASIGRS